MSQYKKPRIFSAGNTKKSGINISEMSLCYAVATHLKKLLGSQRTVFLIEKSYTRTSRLESSQKINK